VRYHRKLHSFEAYGGFGEPYMYLFLFAAVGCMVAVVVLAATASGSDELSLLSLGFGALFLVLLGVLWIARDEFVRRRDLRLLGECRSRRELSEDFSGPASVCLLEEAFHCDRSRFLELAQSIKRAIEIEEAYNKRDRSFGESVLAFLSMPKSSSTLLALFAILATVVTLAGEPELTLSDFFGIIAEAGNVIFSVSAVVVVAVAALVVTLRFYFRELSRVWTFIVLAHLSDDAKSLSAVRNLARDLNRFHSWNLPEPPSVPRWKMRVRRCLRQRASSPSRWRR